MWYAFILNLHILLACLEWPTVTKMSVYLSALCIESVGLESPGTESQLVDPLVRRLSSEREIERQRERHRERERGRERERERE